MTASLGFPWTKPSMAFVVGVMLVAGRSLRAEPPIAPAPEQVVAPATHTVEAGPAATSRLGPVPLPTAEGGRRAAAAARPTTDFRLLAAIAAAFAVLAGFRFFASGRRRAALPTDVFEVLGEAPLAGQHAARIVRFGPKTLLVAVSSSGCQTLAEIADPQSTDRIAAACRGAQMPPRPAGRTPRIPRAGAALLLVLATLAAAPVCAADAAANAPAELAVTPIAPAPVPAPAPAERAASTPLVDAGLGQLFKALSPGTVLPSAVLVGVMSLAPALLLMTTCFVRMSVVLSLLRQGLGAPQIPSNQVVASLAIFLSAMVMWPVWKQAWRDGIEPYQRGTVTAAEACERGSLPIRRWMAAQIEQAGNRDTMLLFLARHPEGPRNVATYDDVPVETLLPAFLVSELETAFAIGFRLLLPFLVLDLLVATLVVSTGLVMLPPTLVSLPLKLLVFVAADGWTLVIQSLLDSVRATTAS
jgi:flagellar biosynthetic protein FliP